MSTTVFGSNLYCGNLQAERHGGPEGGDLAEVAGHDGCFAGQIQRPHQTGAVDHGHVGVVAFVLGPLRHVVHGAVAVVSVDGELLAIEAGHDALFGINGDLGDHRIFRPAEGSAGRRSSGG